MQLFISVKYMSEYKQKFSALSEIDSELFKPRIAHLYCCCSVGRGVSDQSDRK